jgi:hypothetical protein
MKNPIILTTLLITLLTASIATATLAPLTPPPPGGYDSGSNSILDPGCTPNAVDCFVNLPSGGGSVTPTNGLSLIGSDIGLGGTLIQDTNVGLNTFNLGINTPSPDHQFQVTGTFKNQYTDTVSGLISTLDNSSDPIGIGLPGFASTVFNPVSNLTAFNFSTLDGSSMFNISGVGDLTTFSSLSVLENIVDAAGGSANTYLGSGSSDGSGRIHIFRDTVLGQSETRLDNSNFVSGLQSLITNNADLGVTFNFGGVDGLYTFPRVDGLANQVLTTDGAGQLSWQNAGGGSGWSLTGNAGTTAGTNFIGTTDAQDFMVKTNGNQVALFGQNGNIAFGSDLTLIDPLMTAPVASNIGSMAFQSGQATGLYSTAFGVTSATGDLAMAWGNSEWGANIASGLASTVWGNGGNTASASGATSFGRVSTASGSYSTAFGDRSTASGDNSTAFGLNTFARSNNETAFGFNNTDYMPTSETQRLLSIGNGNGTPHNAYTLWKDGSFAYNDDNFQNDNPGTEQNMFYFNYGNHDGNGGVNTKRAIRLGSASDGTWNISSSNVGDRSIALGFSATPLDPSLTGPIASGLLSFATQLGTASGEVSTAFGWSEASGDLSMAWGGNSPGGPGFFPHATGDFSTAWGGNLNTASGLSSTAFGYFTTASGQGSTAWGHNGTSASGDYATAFGALNFARSTNETAFGQYGTDYTPTNSSTDRLLNIGNGTGTGSESDAFTILKDGRTGIAVDNFETNALPLATSVFQVGDGSTGIIGYVDNGTGNWVAVSDERKKDNITDLTYGLNELIQLRPASFNYKRNNEHTIGFLAQQVLPIIPEAVYGTESEGYGMSYATLTPVIVKAIQELNLKVDLISMNTGNTSTSVFDGLKGWLADTANGIQKIFVHEVQTDKLCVGNTCVNEQQLQQLLQNQSIPSTSQNSNPTPSDPVATPSDENPPVVTPDPGNGDNTSTPSDPGMSPVTDTPVSE